MRAYKFALLLATAAMGFFRGARPRRRYSTTSRVMAYLRYTRSCEWYIFERSDSRLTVWHKDFREVDASFDRNEIASFLESDSFDSVPGYRPDQKEILRGAFEAWLQDPVD